MKRQIVWIAAAVTLVLPWSVGAAGQDARQSDGEHLAASCAACHGSAGVPADTLLPALAGQDKQALLARLLAFKSGRQASTIMQQISKGYSDQQLELMAEYFSRQKAPRGAGR